MPRLAGHLARLEAQSGLCWVLQRRSLAIQNRCPEVRIVIRSYLLFILIILIVFYVLFYLSGCTIFPDQDILLHYAFIVT